LPAGRQRYEGRSGRPFVLGLHSLKIKRVLQLQALIFGFKSRFYEWTRPFKIYLHCGFWGKGAIRLEAAAACQLRCPICVDVWQPKKGVGSGTLRFHHFKEFVDRYPYFNEIEISNNGEIFLNNELDQIIQYAHERGIGLTAANGVNLNHVKEKTLENLVRYGFRFLRVSIDGATQSTYEKYRTRGDLGKVLTNIRKINGYKEVFHSGYPLLEWQFILFEHNQHEISQARKMATDLGMKFCVKRNSNPESIPSGAEENKEKGEGMLDADSAICRQLFLAPQINWDGRLLGCCVNSSSNDYGNVFETGLKECIQGERYQYALQMLQGRKEPRNDIVCTECSIYKQMRRSGKYLTEFTLSGRLQKLLE
jgi:MoaA/NifB/PqqE/SkfB family radical SAM enzyme